ncbi:hypothetical protein SKAU_G00350990 [Synaphobranchus kaupii]|uniref:Uncharacterized protein n=1 Tax=Synaphobranchus kaupii TaxID=118154 RepID=A0A9Q1EKC9_SYNKA|nr:hypothetical protein SKAU_G00350990 [Synaphobranchus kaupii]
MNRGAVYKETRTAISGRLGGTGAWKGGSYRSRCAIAFPSTNAYQDVSLRVCEGDMNPEQLSGAIREGVAERSKLVRLERQGKATVHIRLQPRGGRSEGLTGPATRAQLASHRASHLPSPGGCWLTGQHCGTAPPPSL